MKLLNNFSFSQQNIQTYLIEYGLNILMAIAIFVIGRYVAKFVKTIIKKAMERANMAPMLISFFGNIAYALMLAFVIIAALSELGVQTNSIAAIFAAAGLAVGLALQGSLSNFAAGIMIVAFRPFRLGHYIEAAGTGGTVKDINLFTTTLTTPDNKQIIIPNANITSGNITNYSAENTRRIDLVIGCSYGDNLQKVKDVIQKVILEDKTILSDPAPLVAVDTLNASSVDFVVRPWVKSEDYWDTRRNLTQKIKETFDAEGITIPFPQREVHTRQK